ncbi:MAG TPA: zinc ribbon domain-containing protein [Acetivibrio clariflavus]|nr:zinc ribbon domain-containing protein [Acetivibrio clariflavus]
MVIEFAVGVLVASLIALGYVIFMNVKFKETPSEGHHDAFDRETKDRYIKNITNVMKNFNLKTIASTVTEFMYCYIEQTVAVLKKVGIRKEVDIIEDGSFDRDSISDNIVISDGKNNFATALLGGKIVEKYIDNVTDKVLYEKVIEKGIYSLEMIRSDHIERQNANFCSNCGAPMKIEGDFYVCPNCGTKYTTESANWIVANVTCYNYKTENRLTFLYFIPVLIMIVLAFIANYGSWKMKVISVLYDLALLGVVLALCAWLTKLMSGLNKIAKYDKQFSRKSFQKRVEYLVRTYERAKDLDISKVKSLMEPSLYERLKEQNKYDEFYMLDFEIRKLVVRDFEIKDDKQLAYVTLDVNKITINEKKKIKKKKGKYDITLYRHKDTLTDVKLNPEVITCEGCGRNMNLTVDGKCKACGNTYDLSKYDWIIYDISDIK